MEEINDFFDPSKPTPYTYITRAQTSLIVSEDKNEIDNVFPSDQSSPSTSVHGTDYVGYYKKRELERAMEEMRIPEDEGLNAFDDLTSMGDEGQIEELTLRTQMYKNYNLTKKKTQSFTIDILKEKIVNNIASRSVTIIEGATGCGKTTQVPQWILEDCYNKRKPCNIVVTQPRRIAATSVAHRVCKEIGCPLGSLVGYQISLDHKISQSTQLSYVTTGVLLQKLITLPNMNTYTHVILDEVHERNEDMDFLMILVKKLLCGNSKNVKVILMSATIDVSKFLEYFTIPRINGFEMPIYINCNVNTMHNVRTYYLDSLLRLGDVPVIDYSAACPKIDPETMIFAVKLLNAFEKIDLTEEKMGSSGAYSRPSVLIFLPGLYEIEQLFNILNNMKERSKIDASCCHYKWLLVPIHSTLTSEEQAKVFRRPPHDHRKIILSTNITESSITVPDVKYVIDFCLTKMLMLDKTTNFTSLQMKWASKANCKQREGRAGRVQSGRVYRLISEAAYNNLPEDTIPEILRCSLDKTLLSTKILNMGSPLEILSLAMDPPDLSDVHRTILNLKEIGALLQTSSEHMTPDDGDITYLGRIMVKLPVDVRITKLFILGQLFGCLEDALVMGTAMCVKSLFSTPFHHKISAYNSKLAWADGSTSDCIAFLNVYRVWKTHQIQNYFATEEDERNWCKQMFLEHKSIREIEILLTDLRLRLSIEGIKELEGIRSVIWSDLEKTLVLKMIIAGAFYPYYFGFTTSRETDEKDANKILAGHDPSNTVYFTNMDSRQPGIIYTAFLKQTLLEYGFNDTAISFDDISSKVFVTFPDRNIGTTHRRNNQRRNLIVPGKVRVSIYKAIKLRQLNLPISFNVLPLQKALSYAKSLGITTQPNHWKPTKAISNLKSRQLMAPRLPDIDETFVNISVTYVNLTSSNNYWVQYSDSETIDQLNLLDFLLNNDPKDLVKITTLTEGELYAAPYKEGNSPLRYYRARLDKISTSNCCVSFVDYGNNAVIPIESLRTFNNNIETIFSIKALAFECTLTKLAPSIMKDQRAIWTNEANIRLQELTDEMNVLGKIYSVVHGVVSLELIVDDQSINNQLVEEGFAQFAEESYASKVNHHIRQKACNMQPSERTAYNRQQDENRDISNLQIYPPPPNMAECKQYIKLKGPYSPLETNVHNLLYSGRDKLVIIEWDSVNSVLLNTDLQNLNERLLVSAFINQSTSGDRLTLRHTTVMPNIPGLPAILALLFCPKAELRTDPTGERYIAALCGLGHNNGRALYPEHDMLVNIDVELDKLDLVDINYLRHTIDSMLLTIGGQESPMISEEVKDNATSNLKNLIQKLFSRPRIYHEPEPVVRGWTWNSVENNLLAPKFFKSQTIFPLHDSIQLKEPDSNTMQKLAKENMTLKTLCAYSSSNSQIVRCTLCNTMELSIPNMRMHLLSTQHTHGEKKLPKLDVDKSSM